MLSILPDAMFFTGSSAAGQQLFFVRRRGAPAFYYIDPKLLTMLRYGDILNSGKGRNFTRRYEK